MFIFRFDVPYASDDEAPVLSDAVPCESPAFGRRLANVERLIIIDLDATLLGRVCGIDGNHDEDLESLRDADRVYFAEAGHADGILEGFRHYHVRNENVGAGV